MKSLREYLAWAEERGVAIGHFNISDSEGFRAVTEAAAELNVPVLVGISEGESEFIGLKESVSLVKTARENNISVFLNADHIYSVEKARAAIDAGVDSVIIDAAEKAFEENVGITKEVVEYAKANRLRQPADGGREVLVEGELGFIGKSSKILEDLPDGVSEETQTDPKKVREFVEKTGIDLLAPSVGNIHGMIKSGNPKLNIERIKAINEKVEIPLVLHGGSGISDEDFISAIEAGIRIIHINTELRKAYKKGLKEGLQSDEIAPYKFMTEGVEEMKKVVRDRLKLFNQNM